MVFLSFSWSVRGVALALGEVRQHLVPLFGFFARATLASSGRDRDRVRDKGVLRCQRRGRVAPGDAAHELDSGHQVGRNFWRVACSIDLHVELVVGRAKEFRGSNTGRGGVRRV